MASLAIEVPDELNERLEKRAAAVGMTVSEYLADLAKKMAVLPTREEMIERLANLTRADIAASADAVREGREERDDQLDRAVKRLETKATADGVPLERYMIDELARVAAIPTREEMMERLRRLPRVQTTRDPVDVIREVRDGGRRNSS